VTQALVRPGFDPTRHAWSLLANGDWGWIQIANVIVTDGDLFEEKTALKHVFVNGRPVTLAR